MSQNRIPSAGVSQGVDTVAGPSEVLRARVSRSPSPFDVFYRANYGWAVRVAHLLTGERSTAEDVVQDSFGRLHGRLDDIANPGAFLRTSVVNGCRSWHRKQARESRRLGTVAADLHHMELDVRELLDAVDRLPYRQKAVLVLRYYADLSEADIAERPSAAGPAR